jgi:hypothetical protein
MSSSDRGVPVDGAPPPVLDLVERFQANRAAYESGHYNETQVRREFIDPLLKALGWDIDNTAGYAEAYKDVVHEDAIRVEGSPKAPDYSVRIGGTRKFFVEAKKPSVRLKSDPQPAYQLRRYAWSAKLPLSIVTDFAELAVYDCRVRPEPGDSAAKARILYLTVTNTTRDGTRLPPSSPARPYSKGPSTPMRRRRRRSAAQRRWTPRFSGRSRRGARSLRATSRCGIRS